MVERSPDAGEAVGSIPTGATKEAEMPKTIKKEMTAEQKKARNSRKRARQKIETFVLVREPKKPRTRTVLRKLKCDAQKATKKNT